MAARKSKLASLVQDMTIEMPREYLEHVLCKQVNNQDVVRQLLSMFCSFVDGVRRTCNKVTRIIECVLLSLLSPFSIPQYAISVSGK